MSAPKRALVFGGASGIGLATVRALRLQGYEVVVADVNGDGIIDEPMTDSALKMLEIDELGLDPADRQMLKAMHDNYADHPVGLSTIAALTGDETSTIEDFYEPYLLQIGFIERTPRGRRVTPKAIRHISA